MKPEFLDKIITNHKLVRVKNGNKRTWESVKIGKTEVTVIGYRTLWNGYKETDSYNDGWSYYHYFVFEEKVPALLVVKDSRTNPFYIKEL